MQKQLKFEVSFFDYLKLIKQRHRLQTSILPYSNRYFECHLFQKAGLNALELSTPESWAVVGQDNKLGFALTDHLLGLFVAQHVFSTLHHQLETRVDGLHGLFLNTDEDTKVSASTQATTRTTLVNSWKLQKIILLHFKMAPRRSFLESPRY